MPTSYVKYVYVAGPMTLGNHEANLRNGINAAQKLLKAGFLPFVPHLCTTWDLLHPNDVETWLAYDFGWLDRCDALLRLPGESSGADREVAYMRDRDKRVWLGSVNGFIMQFMNSQPKAWS